MQTQDAEDFARIGRWSATSWIMWMAFIHVDLVLGLVCLAQLRDEGLRWMAKLALLLGVLAHCAVWALTVSWETAGGGDGYILPILHFPIALVGALVQLGIFVRDRRLRRRRW